MTREALPSLCNRPTVGPLKRAAWRYADFDALPLVVEEVPPFFVALGFVGALAAVAVFSAALVTDKATPIKAISIAISRMFWKLFTSISTLSATRGATRGFDEGTGVLSNGAGALVARREGAPVSA